MDEYVRGRTRRALFRALQLAVVSRALARLLFQRVGLP
jgi:hypothetical protein